MNIKLEELEYVPNSNNITALVPVKEIKYLKINNSNLIKEAL